MDEFYTSLLFVSSYSDQRLVDWPSPPCDKSTSNRLKLRVSYISCGAVPILSCAKRSLSLLFVPRESRTIGKILVDFTIFEVLRRKMSFRDPVYSELKYDHDVHQ